MTWRAMLGVLGFVAMSGFSLAGLYDITEEEVTCAAGRDVVIGKGADYFSEKAGPRVLTWIADTVVRGVVKDVRQDPKEPYPTTVVIAVSHTYKAIEQTGATISIKLKSGPVYDPSSGEILTAQLIPEPSFAPGEDVIVFLVKDHARHPTVPDYYTLGVGQYAILSKGKYSVDTAGSTARNDMYATEIYSCARISADIAAEVLAQANCGKP